jgi:hypothetical protein
MAPVGIIRVGGSDVPFPISRSGISIPALAARDASTEAPAAARLGASDLSAAVVSAIHGGDLVLTVDRRLNRAEGSGS